VAVGFVFGINQFSIGDDIKNALASGDERRRDARGSLDLRCRTGSLRQVVSHGAILDRDSHDFLMGWAIVSEKQR
jgi:hypothetical protein